MNDENVVNREINSDSIDNDKCGGKKQSFNCIKIFIYCYEKVLYVYVLLERSLTQSAKQHFYL